MDRLVEPQPEEKLEYSARSLLAAERPRVHGKFLYVGTEKLWVRGVTYGTFRPDKTGSEYGQPDIVERDFELMATNAINAVRVYTPPPGWFLDAAQRHGLRVMVGLPWEQHVAFLDDQPLARNIVKNVRAAVRANSGHPAILCYVVGNEIPAPIVRWHGASRVERFIKRLYNAVKEEDAGSLVTYVNYPTTEYLDLPFLDFVAFNVYLESQKKLRAYQARLQNLAGDRPLVMAEIGLDSRNNSLDQQARVLDWQLKTAFEYGCAGVFVFAWTDEWYRGGHDIEDWDFGLTTRAREAKPALETIKNAYENVPFSTDREWPLISVVVCSYNGAATIRDTFEGLKHLEYPNFEIIVDNDGSIDATPEIANRYDVRLISTENCGLSSARNTGFAAADGEIVAYIDDDAYPDPHWLTYLAMAFANSDHAGIGGPNLIPENNGIIAQCIANAPGGPVHVLLTDEVAEHIPGCNMAFRKHCLEVVGGFDKRYRAAGDDVDLCWRIQDNGWTIGFHAAAFVWHHRRNSVRTYWRQQQGYGKAEALLEEKWPERYNAAGHVTWSGRIYGNGLTLALPWNRSRIYQGTWGTALFQSLYQPGSSVWGAFSLMPEWYLVVAVLAGLSLLGLWWSPLLWVLPLLAIAISIPVIQAVYSAWRTSHRTPAVENRLVKPLAITAMLHLIQPLARLKGRLQHGLTLWRRQSGAGLAVPRSRTVAIWRENWESSEDSLVFLESKLGDLRTSVIRGGDFDGWDLEIRGGLCGRARILTTIEEHGAGRQYLRFRIRPRISAWALATIAAISSLAMAAAADGSVIASSVLAIVSVGLGARMLIECARAVGAALQAAERCREHWTEIDRAGAAVQTTENVA